MVQAGGMEGGCEEDDGVMPWAAGLEPRSRQG